MNKNFWKGKRVLVTGHTGFKGAWLMEYLLMLEAEPVGLALAPEDPLNLFDQLNLASRVENKFINILNLSEVRNFASEVSPEIVIHMAAQPLVRQSYLDPVNTFNVNVMGTINVIEACRNLPDLRAFVSITTDKVYENREWLWPYREIDALGGFDPYSASKACAELACQSYNRSFFNNKINLATARAGNVIGGGDWSKDRLVPDIVKAFSAEATAIIRSPHSIRPWQHVLESLNGYLLLAEKLYGSDGAKYSGPWNFGPDADSFATVEEVVKLMSTMWPTNPSWDLDSLGGAHEAKNLIIDSSKARAELLWNSCLDLREAIDLTVEWYNNYRNSDVIELTRLQINKFLEKRDNIC